MISRNAKIIILFILIIAVLIGGYWLYKRLEYNKQSFSANIYEYVSPQAVEVVNINRKFNLGDIFLLNPSYKTIIDALGDNIQFPVVFMKYENDETVLIMRAIQGQDIDGYIPSVFPAKERKYKDVNILLYTLPDGDFLVCARHKGLLVVSKSYKPIELFVDSDAENTFWNNYKDQELIFKILDNSPVGFFTKLENDNMLAFDYKYKSDSITLDGYILKTDRIVTDSISMDYLELPDMISINDSLCIDGYEVLSETNPIGLKVFLNKKF